MSVKQKIIIVATICAVLISFTNVNIVSAEEANDNTCSSMEKVGFDKKAVRPHFNFYYQLLAEKYAPNYVKVWDEVLKDREAIFKNYKELKKAGKEVEPPYDDAWLKKHSEVHQQFVDAVEKRDEASLKEMVPKVIEHQRELNLMWKKKIKEVK